MAIAHFAVLDHSAIDHAVAGGRESGRLRTRQTKEERTARSRAQKRQLIADLREGKEPILESWSIQTELFVVSAEDLYAVFKGWFTRRGMVEWDASTYVASEIGCHEDVPARLKRKKWVPLSFAEALLIVLGMEYATYNGEVPVYANQNFTMKQWCLRADSECVALEWLLHTHPDQWSAAA